jgi:hypothetical protein
MDETDLPFKNELVRTPRWLPFRRNALRVRCRKVAGNKSRAEQVFISVWSLEGKRLRPKAQAERIGGQPGVEARKSPGTANDRL